MSMMICSGGQQDTSGSINNVDDQTNAVAESSTTNFSKDIDHRDLLCDDISSLAMKDDFHDVTFRVEGRLFHAHRVILACRCSYFRALLFGGMRESTSQTEITLEDVSSHAFETLLLYAYSGRLKLNGEKLEHCIAILRLANNYGYTLLEKGVSDHLNTSLTVDNCCTIYNVAMLYSQNELIKSCADYIDRHCLEVINSPGFVMLSIEAVRSILLRDSFCVQEKMIFRSAQKWCNANLSPNDENLVAKQRKVLEAVRLPLISLHDLLHVVRPTGLVSPDSLLDAVKAQSERSSGRLMSRGVLRPDENIATLASGAQVTHGGMPAALLDTVTTEYDNDNGFTYHEIAPEGSTKKEKGIKIKLGLPSIINRIRMLLWAHDLRSFSYYVQVSTNDKHWQTVVDHTKALCRSWQDLRFDHRVVRYIRVVGTRSTTSRVFQLVSLEASYSTDEISLNDGFIIPLCNVATLEKSACIIEGVSRDRNALINGDTNNFDWDSGYTCHQLKNGGITVQLAQPYLITCMKLLLWDMDDRAYSYYIEFSLDNATWTEVVDKRRDECKSWQDLQITMTPATFIRIVGTNNTANEVFHCVHFECSGDPLSTPPPSVCDFATAGDVKTDHEENLRLVRIDDGEHIPAVYDVDEQLNNF